MADLPESSKWTPGVYQIETSDPVVGGPEGVTNRPIKQLTDRTVWLKRKLEALINGTEPVGEAKQLAPIRSTSRHLTDYGVAFASQYEAEQGADTNKPMSALRVLQAIRSRIVQATEHTPGIAHLATPMMVRAGTDEGAIVTPATLAAMLPLRGVKVYSLAGVYAWEVPSGVHKAWVEVIAAGGGGARLTTEPGASGGSGGGYAKKLVNLKGIKSVTISVGVGGKGAQVDGKNGGNGGTSSFATTVWASGGEGGTIDGKAPQGGQGVGGDENGTIGQGGLARSVEGTFGYTGGAGGGGVSMPAWTDNQTPRKPGHGGGGRGGSTAPNGADGQVSIKW